jgi:hypothetical protein
MLWPSRAGQVELNVGWSRTSYFRVAVETEVAGKSSSHCLPRRWIGRALTERLNSPSVTIGLAVLVWNPRVPYHTHKACQQILS